MSRIGTPRKPRCANSRSAAARMSFRVAAEADPASTDSFARACGVPTAITAERLADQPELPLQPGEFHHVAQYPVRVRFALDLRPVVTDVLGRQLRIAIPAGGR